MSSTGKTKVLKLDQREIICRELSVSDVRKLLSSGPPDSLVDMLFPEIQVSDIPVFTSLTVDEVEEMMPSDLRTVIDACREVNPDFFGMLARLNPPLKPA